MKLNTKSLAEVELGFPVFAEGTYHATIVKVEVKPNNSKDGNNLLVVARLDDPVLYNKDGKEIQNRGNFKLTRYVSLKPTDSYDPDQRLKEIAVAIGHPPEQDLELADLENKTCMVKITTRPAEGAYTEQSELARFTKQPDDDLFSSSPLG